MKNNNKMVSAVITAAGNGTRFGGDKMLVKLKGETILIHTLRNFHQSRKVDEIILAVRKEAMKKYQNIIRKVGFRIKIVPGGSERIVSVYNGVKTSTGRFVITHDGARPFSPVWLIDKLIEETIKYGAAMTAVTPTATIKDVDNDYFIKKSLPRKTTWIAQTPQGFKRNIILDALKKAIKDKYFVATDDSELVTKLGVKVRVVPGDEINMKITFPHDLVIAEQLLELSSKLKNVQGRNWTR